MPAASALPPVMASEQWTPATPSSSRTCASLKAARLAGSAPISTALGSWISISGQPAAARASRSGRRLSAAARASAADGACVGRGLPPGRRPGPGQDRLDRSIGQGRRRPPPRHGVLPHAEARIGDRFEARRFLGPHDRGEQLGRRWPRRAGVDAATGRGVSRTSSVALRQRGLTRSLRRGSCPPTADGIVRSVKTILVVDDERHIVDLIRLYLERDGFAVLTRRRRRRGARDGRPARPRPGHPRPHAPGARTASRSAASSAGEATRRS